MPLFTHSAAESAGTGFVDDGDDPHGDGDPADLEPGRHGPSLQYPAHGVGQRGGLPEPVDDVGENLVRDLETLPEGRRQLRGRGQVGGVGGEDRLPAVQDFSRHTVQRFGPALPRKASQCLISGLGSAAHFLYGFHGMTIS